MEGRGGVGRRGEGRGGERGEEARKGDNMEGNKGINDHLLNLFSIMASVIQPSKPLNSKEGINIDEEDIKQCN